jgi:hypothetical protein
MKWAAMIRDRIYRLFGGLPARDLPAQGRLVEQITIKTAQPRLLTLDRPFDTVDYQKLVSLYAREPVFFEWLGHCVKHTESEIEALKNGPETHCDRIALLAARRAFLRVFNVGEEGAYKSAQIEKRFAAKEEKKEKGAKNG